MKVFGYLGYPTGDFERKVRMIQGYTNYFSYKITKEMEEKMNFLRIAIEKSEVIQTSKVNVAYAMNIILEPKKKYNSLDTQYKRILLSIIFSVSFLVVNLAVHSLIPII